MSAGVGLPETVLNPFGASPLPCLLRRNARLEGASRGALCWEGVEVRMFSGREPLGVHSAGNGSHGGLVVEMHGGASLRSAPGLRSRISH
jgi:hypothetical protein